MGVKWQKHPDVDPAPSLTHLLLCSCINRLSSRLGKEKDSGVSDSCSLTSSHRSSSVWNLYSLHT